MEPMGRLAHFSPISVSWIDMQWDTQIERMETGRIHQVKILCDGEPVSYDEV